MSQTPDRKPGPVQEDEEIQLGPNVTAPSLPGAVNYDGTKFQMRDSFGVFDPRSGSGVPPASYFGQVLYSVDGAIFSPQLPLTGCGWLQSDLGILLVVG